jgi:hypothetical protein
MLNRTRVSGAMDTGRLGNAVSRPGIDPRMWVSNAIALGDSVVDPQHGVFVDVILHPSEQQLTALVTAIYAGNGWGIYAKVHKDDPIQVSIPSGHQAEGASVIQRGWNAADLPPKEAIDNPDDLVIVVEPGKNFRLAVSGGGQILLGGELATHPVIMGDDFRNAESQQHSSEESTLQTLASAMGALQTAATTWATSAPTAVTVPGLGAIDAAGAAALATAAGALQSAASAILQAIKNFEQAASNDQNFLSKTVNVES